MARGREGPRTRRVAAARPARACLDSARIGGTRDGRLEYMEKVQNCQDPEFCNKLVGLIFDKVQKLKFSVYDIDNKSFDLNDDDYLGEIECAGSGCVRLSVHPTAGIEAGKAIRNGHYYGISAEEIKDTRVVYLEIEAQNVDKKDFLGKLDHFEFEKQSHAGAWQLVYRAEVIKNLTSCWRKFSVPLQTFCGGDLTNLSSAGGKSTLFSSSDSGQMEYECIHPEKKQKKNNYKNSGIIRIKSCKIETEYSFLDNVMGGCQINFIVGVDFTASSGDPNSPDSFHYVSPDGISQYLIAIWSVGSVVQNYDTYVMILTDLVSMSDICDKLFPAFGFGAQVPPSWQHYFILLIITDGEITDLDQTRQAIVNASNLPVSIIIVGVGEANFKAMEFLDGDSGVLKSVTGEPAADIVQFVSFQQFKNASQEALSQIVLAKVPKQLV
ncbi:LOW QUALITY PROTEIN: copine-1 [Geothlypis trichas]